MTKANEKLARQLEKVLRQQGKEPTEYIVVEEPATNLPKIEINNGTPTYVNSIISYSRRVFLFQIPFRHFCHLLQVHVK